MKFAEALCCIRQESHLLSIFVLTASFDTENPTFYLCCKVYEESEERTVEVQRNSFSSPSISISENYSKSFQI